MTLKMRRLIGGLAAIVALAAIALLLAARTSGAPRGKDQTTLPATVMRAP